MRKPNVSFSTWSSHSVSLYGWRNRCEWPSIKPGMSVVPGSATRWAPAGTLVESARPTLSMWLPRTTTTQPLRGASATPSHTWSGASTIGGAGSPVARGCAEAVAASDSASSEATGRRVGRRRGMEGILIVTGT